MTIQRLKDKGAEVISLGDYAVPMRDLMWALYRRGIKKILLEGGGSTSRRMFNEGLVDEVYLTIAPVLIGQGVDLFHGELDRNIELGLEGILQYGDHVILHYTVKHGE